MMILPCDLLRAQIGYPTWVGVCQMTILAAQLAEVDVSRFVVGFWDKTKAISLCLYSITR